jgi:prophage maintenance system killer protein
MMFCRINDFELECSVDESVITIVNLASDELSQEDLAIWIRKHSIEKKF